MLEQAVRQAILELHRRGQGVRAIARALRVSRAAVRDILRRGSAEVPRLERQEKALEHREDIVRLLQECEGSLIRVHEELAKLGVELSYPALTAFCRRHGIGQEPKQPAGRYDFAPGQEMQHDTSPHDLHLGGKLRRVQTASLVLAYSRMLFFQFYPQFRRFECKGFLTDALRYLDGACQTCMIDNTHVVVLKGTGPAMIPVPEMAAFAERFGFTFVAHAVGDANRSGRVERMFRFIERGFLPGRRFTDWADANRQARAWCDRANGRPKRHLKATPRELFATEHPALRRLPRWIPEPSLLHGRLVDVEGYVTLHTNHYSVPTEFIGRRLEVRESQDRVVIYAGPREITEHAREVDPLSRYLFRPEHRPPPRPGRARARSRAVPRREGPAPPAARDPRLPRRPQAPREAPDDAGLAPALAHGPRVSPRAPARGHPDRGPLRPLRPRPPRAHGRARHRHHLLPTPPVARTSPRRSRR
jgi:predicted transcriptional regulator